jgi:hypothetical protein
MKLAIWIQPRPPLLIRLSAWRPDVKPASKQDFQQPDENVERPREHAEAEEGGSTVGFWEGELGGRGHWRTRLICRRHMTFDGLAGPATTASFRLAPYRQRALLSTDR